MNGPRGPAVARFPAASKKSWDPVKAVGSSLPSATVVDSRALDDPAMPEPVSDAEQLIETLLAFQPVGRWSQVTVGSVRSTLFPPIGPAVAQLPAESQTW